LLLKIVEQQQQAPNTQAGQNDPLAGTGGEGEKGEVELIGEGGPLPGANTKKRGQAKAGLSMGAAAKKKALDLDTAAHALTEQWDASFDDTRAILQAAMENQEGIPTSPTRSPI